MASGSDLHPVDLDSTLERVTAGEPLAEDALAALARSPDILAAGALADAVRRRACGSTVTFLRVASLVAADVDRPQLVVASGARDLRVEVLPEGITDALGMIARLRACAPAACTVSAGSWADVVRWGDAGGGRKAVLAALRGAGVDHLIDAPIDEDESPEAMVEELVDAGFRAIRLTTSQAAPTDTRLLQFLRVAPVVARRPEVCAIAPLPRRISALRPTTGYDDVKAVALARLAVPGIAHVQVDWLRYGPKLAQVVLTFGADDIDCAPPEDESPDGRRRAPIEELRRNVAAAGFTPVERDGRFAPVPVPG